MKPFLINTGEKILRSDWEKWSPGESSRLSLRASVVWNEIKKSCKNYECLHISFKWQKWSSTHSASVKHDKQIKGRQETKIFFCRCSAVPDSSWWHVNTWCRGERRLSGSQPETSSGPSCFRETHERRCSYDSVLPTPAACSTQPAHHSSAPGLEWKLPWIRRSAADRRPPV